jgi:hypothetical protein
MTNGVRSSVPGWALLVVLLSGARAHADPAIKIQARMILRATGELDDDLLKGATKARVGNLDYGELAREMLVTVAVAESKTEPLVVTVKQGKLNVTQTWKVAVGAAYGLPVAHFPILISPTFCGGPMTITAKYGPQTEKRTIDFACSESQ